jgi:hypothetical protein
METPIGRLPRHREDAEGSYQIRKRLPSIAQMYRDAVHLVGTGSC